MNYVLAVSTAAALAVSPTLEYFISNRITGRSILTSAVVAGCFALFYWLRAVQLLRQARRDEQLRRRALMHRNGGHGLTIIAVLTVLALLAGSVHCCIGAEPVQLDQLLSEGGRDE